jgi:hypothetical protein
MIDGTVVGRKVVDGSSLGFDDGDLDGTELGPPPQRLHALIHFSPILTPSRVIFSQWFCCLPLLLISQLQPFIWSILLTKRKSSSLAHMGTGVGLGVGISTTITSVGIGVGASPQRLHAATQFSPIPTPSAVMLSQYFA